MEGMTTPPMTNLLLILHGKAAADPAVREAVEAVRKRGASIEVRVTWEAGQAAQFAAEAAKRGVEAIVAGGGDGTVNEVLQGLLSGGEEVAALGVLPLGTANDFARTLDIPLDNPLAALEIVAAGHTVPVDVGLVNNRPFINVASGGLGAEITQRTPDAMKSLLGGAAYSITGLLAAPELKPYDCALTVQGKTVNLTISTLAVANARYAGGGFDVAPQSKLDDGLLDLVIVPVVPLANLSQLVGELFQPAAAENQHILYQQLSEFSLAFAADFPINVDGESLVAREFHFSLLPRHLRVLSAGKLSKAEQSI
jgi:lipid kinase YegS